MTRRRRELPKCAGVGAGLVLAGLLAGPLIGDSAVTAAAVALTQDRTHYRFPR